MTAGPSTRRRFLKVMSAAALGVAAIALGFLGSPYRLAREWLLSLDPDDAPGELAGSHLRALLAVTETIADRRIQRAHYEDLFRWRALTLPGHRSLYERLSAMLDDEARRFGRSSFHDCVEAERDRILARLDELRRNRVQRMIALAIDREWLLLDEHVIQPALVLFSRTDAWVLLGYPSWPGVARGFASLDTPRDRHTRGHRRRGAD